MSQHPETIDVTELMDIDGPGDEHHPDEHWDRCPECGVDVRSDMDECWRCGTEMVRGPGEFDLRVSLREMMLWTWLDDGPEGER